MAMKNKGKPILLSEYVVCDKRIDIYQRTRPRRVVE